MNLLDVEGLHHGYNGHQVVRGLDFALAHGSIGCLLGPSGCGKTTVLRCIAGFETLRAGSIRLSGVMVSGPGAMLPPEDAGTARSPGTPCRCGVSRAAA